MDQNLILEAKSWWLSLFDDKADAFDGTSPPEIRAVKKIWKKNFPFFTYFTLSESKKDKHWKIIFDLVSQMLKPEAVQDPNILFPEFLVSLYKNRELFCPKTVDSCVAFCHKFAPASSSYFLTFQAPFFFGSHILYLHALIRLIDTNDQLWITLKSKQVSVNLFLKFYLAFLTPIEKRLSPSAILWKQRLLLSHVLYQLLYDTAKSNSDAVTLTNTFCDKLINLIPNAPSEIETSIVRDILSLTKRISFKTSRDVIQSRFASLLSVISTKTSQCSFHIIFLYLYQARPRVVPGSRIMRAMLALDLSTPLDIDNAMQMADYAGPLPVLKFLARNGMKSKQWLRSCFTRIRDLFVKYSSDVEVCEWGQTLIRRLFIYIGIAYLRGKSKTKTIMLCEALAFFANVHLMWCQNAIHVTASSLYSAHVVPPYFTKFFSVNAPVDPAIVANFNEFNNNNTCLKTFPFDKKGNFIFNASKQSERLHASPRSVQTKRLVKPLVKKTSAASNVLKSKLPSLHIVKLGKK